MDITSFAEDHPTIDITDAGNGHDNGVKSEHNVFHFGFNFMDLPIEATQSGRQTELPAKIGLCRWNRQTSVPEFLIPWPALY